MTADELRQLLFAPEIIVVDLADAALIALERALRVEHPLLDAPPPTEHPPVCRHARAVLRHALRLRLALRRYRCVVHNVVREAEQPDFPF
jgi:hypothetical protein